MQTLAAERLASRRADKPKTKYEKPRAPVPIVPCCCESTKQNWLGGPWSFGFTSRPTSASGASLRETFHPARPAPGRPNQGLPNHPDLRQNGGFPVGVPF